MSTYERIPLFIATSKVKEHRGIYKTMVDTPSIAISLQNTKPFRTNFGSVGPLEVKRTTPVKSAGISSLLVGRGFVALK